jgi:glycosyltransferase involved in cell wall biosynthesis
MGEQKSGSQSVDARESDRLSVSVFFPCYNEQANVKGVVTKALDLLRKLDADFEIIIVNDGSTDQTARIADEAASQDGRVKVIHHSENLGYGAALQSGFRAASKELVFYTDGDGQFDINEMPALLPLMEDYDVVSCYRLNRQDSSLRKFNAWCWTKLVCLLFHMKLRDIDCAFKLYKTKIFENMQMRSTGALIDAEILGRMTRKGYKVVQRPVHHYPRTEGQQTGAKIGVIFRAFKELLKLRKEILADRSP